MKLWLTAAGLAICLFVSVAHGHDERAQPAHGFRLSSEEQEWLDRHRDLLTLFFNPDFPPIEFADAEGAFTGLGADVIAMIEERLGIEFRKAVCEDWNKHLAALESGECAVAPTIVRTPRREGFAFFTTPYATVPVVIIATRSGTGMQTFDDLAECRVAVVSGYATERYVNEQANGRFEVVPLWNVPTGLRAVSFGEVDAFVENLAVAAYYIEQEGVPNLRVAGNTDFVFAWSIGVSRQYPLLYSAIQKALESIPEGDLEAARTKWISLEPHRRLAPETLQRLKWSALFILLLVSCLTLITVLLKRRLHERVESLRLAEEDLRKSEEKYRVLIGTIPDLVLHTSVDGTIVYINDVDFSLLNAYGREAVLGRNMFEFLVPEDRERARQITERMFDAYQGIQEYRLIGPHGEIVPCEVNGAILRDPKRTPSGMVYVIRDVSARKSAEAEHARLQEQLVQAQKMESVGRLAGGVAHDFNNMLGVILGHTELAKIQLPPDHPTLDDLKEIENAAQRSADLTRQLLAFARKQTIAPKVLDLNSTIGETLKMLRRLIGEDIELDWHPGVDPWCVKMDPVQIDQILANLTLNAREAIEGTGKIAIATANVHRDELSASDRLDASHDEYVLLSVRDTGRGMDEAEQAHVFEPFFTTKGKGTGLGLATVFGIVKQNHGFIRLDSAPGKGSTFRLYLPRCHGTPAATTDIPAGIVPGGRGKTILLMEDEPATLRTVERLLDELAYNVLPASTPQDAIRLAERHEGEIDLLITDVVMPGMNGRDLAERLRAIRPGLRCLYMSGYTADVITSRGLLHEGVQFLQKPFTSSGLAKAIQDALNAA